MHTTALEISQNLGDQAHPNLSFGLITTTKSIVFLKQSKTISRLPPPYAFIGSLQRSEIGERDPLSKKADETATPKKSQRKTARVYRNGVLKIHGVRHHSFLETN